MGVERAPAKELNRGNNKENGAEVTDVDAMGQGQEFAAREQAAKSSKAKLEEDQSKQQWAWPDEEVLLSLQTWRRGVKEGASVCVCMLIPPVWRRVHSTRRLTVDRGTCACLESF